MFTRSICARAREIIETNTFGANRKRLAAFGFAEKLRQINQAGVRIAKEVARTRLLSREPSGRWGSGWSRLGPVSFAEARELFREQVTALVEAGVDLLILETFPRSGRAARSGAGGARSGGPRDPA